MLCRLTHKPRSVEEEGGGGGSGVATDPDDGAGCAGDAVRTLHSHDYSPHSLWAPRHIQASSLAAVVACVSTAIATWQRGSSENLVNAARRRHIQNACFELPFRPLPHSHDCVAAADG